jgi:hypothetical protein
MNTKLENEISILNDKMYDPEVKADLQHYEQVKKECQRKDKQIAKLEQENQTLHVAAKQ